MICNAMKNHPKKKIVQSEACCTIATMIWCHADVSPKIAQLDGINLVITAMKKWMPKCNTNNDMLSQVGCAALKELSYNENNKKIIDAGGGLQVVLTAMERNPTAIYVQKEGCHFLQNMTTNYSIHTAIEISKHHVVPMILKALQLSHKIKNKNNNNSKKKKYDIEFQLTVCGLIANLASFQDTTVAAVVSNSNVIAIVFDTLNTANNLHVEQEAILALEFLATCSVKNQAMIWHKGGLQAAFNAIESYPNNKTLLISSFNLIEELCQNDTDGKVVGDIARLNGIQLLLTTMEENQDLVKLQVTAFVIIGFLILEKDDDKMYAPTLVKIIVSVMKKHNDNDTIQIQACDALFELSQVSSSHEILMESETQQMMLQVKSRYEDSVSDVNDIFASCKGTYTQINSSGKNTNNSNRKKKKIET